MIERIHTSGARRLFALKDWTIINQASMWVRIYGLQLDAAYQQWIKRIDDIGNSYAKKVTTHPCGAVTQRCGIERIGAI